MTGNAAPQTMQNRLSSGISALQLGHSMPHLTVTDSQCNTELIGAAARAGTERAPPVAAAVTSIPMVKRKAPSPIGRGLECGRRKRGNRLK